MGKKNTKTLEPRTFEHQNIRALKPGTLQHRTLEHWNIEQWNNKTQNIEHGTLE